MYIYVDSTVHYENKDVYEGFIDMTTQKRHGIGSYTQIQSDGTTHKYTGNLLTLPYLTYPYLTLPGLTLPTLPLPILPYSLTLPYLT